MFSKKVSCIVLCGGGYSYFTNAWVCIRILQMLGCKTPIELWMFSNERDKNIDKLANKLEIELRIAEERSVLEQTSALNLKRISPAIRQQWALKPYAICNARKDHIIYLDVDNVAIVDPTFLLNVDQYHEYGSIFWPDFLRMTPDRKIWAIMGIPFRDEPEFETGQMVIDKQRCGEALEFALWMNQRAEFFYKYIWGDKDTFRFAWHKYGLPYSMVPYPIQPLDVPGRLFGGGVMCQHDFEGNRIFQHRNLAKWSLLSDNPRIPGFLYETECREFLAELRGLWNGRLNWQPLKRNHTTRGKLR